jgi:protein-histidine pros-kinase
MSLRLKFNLVVFAVMITGLLVGTYFLYDFLQKRAREEVLHDAGLMMETALAIRAYTNTQVKPHLAKQLEETFLPQSVPAFAATETLSELRKNYPAFVYKEATLNPTNPRDRAVGWEADIVNGFRGNQTQTETSGMRSLEGNPSLYIARPIKIKDPACLACHSTPQAAPASLVKVYGETNGFGWQHNEIVGVQLVEVPMSLPIQRARDTLVLFMGALVTLFLVMAVIMNILLDRLVVRPLAVMASHADAISVGKTDLEALNDSGSDEIAKLAKSFNRMVTSYRKAVQLIKR